MMRKILLVLLLTFLTTLVAISRCGPWVISSEYAKINKIKSFKIEENELEKTTEFWYDECYKGRIIFQFDTNGNTIYYSDYPNSYTYSVFSEFNKCLKQTDYYEGDDGIKKISNIVFNFYDNEQREIGSFKIYNPKDSFFVDDTSLYDGVVITKYEFDSINKIQHKLRYSKSNNDSVGIILNTPPPGKKPIRYSVDSSYYKLDEKGRKIINKEWRTTTYSTYNSFDSVFFMDEMYDHHISRKSLFFYDSLKNHSITLSSAYKLFDKRNENYYDSNNLLKKTKDFFNDTLVTSSEYYYNTNKLIIRKDTYKSDSLKSRIHYTYDSLKLIKKEELTFPDSSIKIYLSEYNQRGLEAKIQYFENLMFYDTTQCDTIYVKDMYGKYKPSIFKEVKEKNEVYVRAEIIIPEPIKNIKCTSERKVRILKEPMLKNQTFYSYEFYE